jgi:hypothetical protein
MFAVKVKQISGEFLSVELESGTQTSIRELKIKLVHVTGIEFERQRLIFSGRVLGDGDRLETYGISEESTIQLVARPQDIPTPSPAPPNSLPESAAVPQFRNLGNGVLMGSITLDGSNLSSSNTQVHNIIGQMMNLAQSFVAPNVPSNPPRDSQPSAPYIPPASSEPLPSMATSPPSPSSELLASAHLQTILRTIHSGSSPTTSSSLPTALHDLFRVLNGLQVPVVNLTRELPSNFDGES